VTAIGETFNYLTSTSQRSGLRSMFYRVFAALEPGGIFIFDAKTTVSASPKGRTGRSSWRSNEILQANF
jgi:hypothetical protein